jgi:hypothetical protein
VTWISILTPYRRNRATFLDFLELISSPKTTSYKISKKCLAKSKSS